MQFRSIRPTRAMTMQLKMQKTLSWCHEWNPPKQFATTIIEISQSQNYVETRMNEMHNFEFGDSWKEMSNWWFKSLEEHPRIMNEAQEQIKKLKSREIQME